MTIHGARLRTLGFICSEFVRRLHPSRPAAHQDSRHKRRGKRWFVYFRLVSEFEDDQRALQDALESAQRGLDQTLTLINEAQATRVRVHIGARLSQMKAQTRNSTQRVA